MKSVFRLFLILVLCLGLNIPWLNAAPGTLADSPLFLASTVKPNILMAIDDSGSMDSENLMPTNDGALWWHTGDQSFTGRDQNDNAVGGGVLNFNQNGNANNTWKRYFYLFPNGSGTTTSGRRVYTDTDGMYVVPPTHEFAYARSPDYNASYYDPDVAYTPWVSYSGKTFSNADPHAAYFDPFYSSSGTLDLTTDFDNTHANWNSSNWQFRFYPGMLDVDQATTIASITDKSVAYFPATYYRPAGTPDNSGYTGSATCLDCRAPDGTLMDKYEIKPTNYATTAQYDAAIQNFANWFSYYRRRHQAMRAGIGQAFDGQQNLNVGIFSINNRTSVTMLDMGVSGERDQFYGKLYAIVGNSGTPNRQAVYHMGDLFAAENNGVINYQCQQNFGILFTDGYSNNSSTGFNVGNADRNLGAPYEDGTGNTLADVAMYFYNTQLRSTEFPTAGQVPVPSACFGASPDPWTDCNSNLHMSFFAVTLGSKGHIYGVTHNTIADAYSTPPTWQAPNAARDPVQIDDLYHGTINGRGDMLNATTPAEIKNVMRSTLEAIAARTGSAAPVSFSASSLSSNTKLFLTQFDSGTWSGSLHAYSLTSDGGISASIWNAATILTNRNLTVKDRVIISYDTATTSGIPFRWSSLSPSQQDDLRTDGSGAIEGTDTNGRERLEYLRGKRGCEQSNTGSCSMASRDLRPRTSVLGDLIHSSPAYVAKPEQRWPDTAPFPESNSYSQFKTNQASRQAMVYVGANDGMLHGFAANSGDEVFAYIPASLYHSGTTVEGLHLLSQRNYSHKYYVDHTPTVTDAYVGYGTRPREWRSVLVGSLRGGGKGIYALDITNPNLFNSETSAKDQVMWEFTHNDMGYTYGQPVVVPLGDQYGIDWYVVVAGGYNDDADGGGTDGEAKLFIIKLSGPGSDGVWDLDTDYFVISTGVGSVSNRNGMGEIQVVDYNRDFIADTVYAGDLQGNLWAFNIKGAPSGSWSTSRQPKKLFTTVGNQPITGRPMVAFHPTVTSDSNNKPNLMVYFGTGQYLVDGDVGTTNSQYFYGVWDKGTDSTNLTSANLQLQVFNQFSSGGIQVRTVSENTVNYLGTTPQYGWYIALPDVGERMVTNPVVVNNTVFFNTLVPSSTPCSYGGSGWIVGLDTATGGRTSYSVFDLNKDHFVNNADKVNDGGTDTVANGQKVEGSIPQSPTFLGSTQFTSNSKGEIVISKTSDGSSDITRQSWHLIPSDRVQ